MEIYHQVSSLHHRSTCVIHTDGYAVIAEWTSGSLKACSQVECVLAASTACGPPAAMKKVVRWDRSYMHQKSFARPLPLFYCRRQATELAPL